MTPIPTISPIVLGLFAEMRAVHHTSYALVHEEPPTCKRCGVQMFTGIAPTKSICTECQGGTVMVKIPTFEEWFASEHGGRSFDENYDVKCSRYEAVLMCYMQEIASYTQAMAQLTHDTMLKELESRK